MSESNIAIATVADRAFLPAACCQLVSTANNLDNNGDVQLFIVICDAPAEEICNADRFFRDKGIAVEIVIPDFLEEMMTPLPTRWPRSAYLRLYFDRIFDRRWKRVVYFDADTRVCAPLRPLLNADLRGQPIGAAHDFIYYITGNIHRRRRDLFLTDDAPYFQSGVMVFDWQMLLANGGLAATRQFLMTHPDSCYEAPDQDALNATFENRWTPLDPRWNLHELYLMHGNRLQPWIQHFTSTKPWSRQRPRAWREAAAWYRSELNDSPWPDFVEPQRFHDAVRADLKFALIRFSPFIRDALASNQRTLSHWLGLKPARIRTGYKPWVPRHRIDVEDMALALIREAHGLCPPLRPPENVLKYGHW
jgi:lipopolysaccharide biosynthesis glycosyltransferase